MKKKSTVAKRNPHFDKVADLKRKCADLIEIVEGARSPHDSWRSTHFCGRRLKDTPEWAAFYVSAQNFKP